MPGFVLDLLIPELLHNRIRYVGCSTAVFPGRYHCWPADGCLVHEAVSGVLAPSLSPVLHSQVYDALDVHCRLDELNWPQHMSCALLSDTQNIEVQTNLGEPFQTDLNGTGVYG